MKNITDTLTTYFRAWNEEGRTAELLGVCCTPDIQYVDPRNTCRSVGELAARIDRGRSEAPSSRVDFTSAVDGYGATFRYTWLFVVPDMKLRIPGWDVITRDAEGRIATITSFFGDLEGAEAGSPLRLQPTWKL